MNIFSDIHQVVNILGFTMKQCRRLLKSLEVVEINRHFKWKTSDVIELKKKLDASTDKRLRKNRTVGGSRKKTENPVRRTRPY